MDGTVKDVQSDYMLQLSEPTGEGNIEMYFKVVNSLWGLIMKVGKDDEGDLYNLGTMHETYISPSGKDREDEDMLFGLFSCLKRMKFDEQFQELTISCDSDTTMQFRRS